MTDWDDFFTGEVHWFHANNGTLAAVGDASGAVWLLVVIPNPDHVPRVLSFYLAELTTAERRLPVGLRGRIEIDAHGRGAHRLPAEWLELLKSQLSLALENVKTGPTESHNSES